MMNKTTKWILWVVLLLILVLYPRLFGFYFTNIFVVFAIYALYAITFNILLGYTGLLSFGHAMFFGTGGYATAIALERIEGLPLFPAILIGLLAAIVLALILCPLLVRVSGVAFAMLTLAFGLGLSGSLPRPLSAASRPASGTMLCGLTTWVSRCRIPRRLSLSSPAVLPV
jgi:branched-chain amino acid transport system permease protein